MARVPVIVLLTAISVPGAFGQRVSMGHPPAPASRPGLAPAAPHSSTRIFVGNGFGYGRYRRSLSRYGWPYFADYGYGYDSEPYGYPPPPAPELQVAPQPLPAAQESKAPLPSPVLLELHGDQWVQVNSFTPPPAQTRQLSAENSKPAELPPAVLVFRDGHTEEVSSYSIIGPVIYTKSDYWASGSWTRKIQIADLNLPATLKQNQDRGVKFELPSSPDEIMLRP
jgi:hypothetical protein